MNKFKAVVFDVDGVMLDSEPFFAEGRAAIVSRFGLTLPDGNINGSGMRAYWRGVLESCARPDLSADDLSALNFDYTLGRIIETDTPPADGLTELLDELRTMGLKLAVASSSDRSYVEAVLGRIGITGRFEVTVCGTEAGRAKPFPDLYAAAAEKLGLMPSECVAIEDSDNGIRAAKDAGLFCIGLDCSAPRTQSFSACDVTVRSLREVSKIISDGR